MKTSKKLLSFFLAIVMVVTTCSVGMTAFAQENNKSIWTTKADSETTYAALNQLVDEYVPMLLNIDAVKDLLENNLGITVTDDTSIQDILVAVSPILVNALGAGGDKSTIIPDYTKMSDIFYSYLDDTSEDVTAGDMDFFALYSLCQAAKSSSNSELKDFATATLDELEGYLKAYSDAYSNYKNNTDRFADEIIPGYWDKLVEQAFDGDYDLAGIASYDYISNCVVDGVAFKDLQVADNEREGLKDICAFINSVYSQSPNNTMTASSICDAAYYYNSVWAIPPTVSEINISLISAGDGKIAWENNEGKTVYLTLDNYKEVISKDISFKDFLRDEMQIDLDDPDTPQNLKDMFVGAENSYQGIILLSIFEGDDTSYDDFSNPYYYELVLGLLSTQSENYSSLDEVKKAAAEKEITDAQIKKVIEDAHSQNWMQGYTVEVFRNYMDSSECPFSEEAKKFIRTYDTSKGEYYTILGRAFLDAPVDTDGKATQESVDYTRAFISDMPRFKVGEMNFIDAVNYMIPSIMALNEFGNGTKAEGSLSVTGVTNTLSEFHKVMEPRLPVGCYDFTNYKDQIKNEYYIDIANNTINSLVDNYLAAGKNTDLGGMELPLGDLINSVVNGILGTSNFAIADFLNDIYLRLYNDPVSTIFGLVPILIALVDEFLMPYIFNEGSHTELYAIFNGLGLITDYTQDAGSPIGIGALNFNLNKILPDVLHWLAADPDYTFTYYDVTENEDGSMTYGTNLTTGTYNLEKTPVITNIYFVDSMLQYAKISDIEGGAGEIVSELAGFFTVAVDQFLEEHGEDVKLDYEGSPVSKGANNLFVAIPYILDSMGQAFIDKYELKNEDGSRSDWTYIYDGKMTITEVDGNTVIKNNRLEKLKGLIDEGSNPTDVLEIFTNTLTEDWLGALVDLINDVARGDETGKNKITNEIPIVANLLAAFDLFGEKSVLTDLLNSIFQMTRENKYSFSFEEQKTTGYTALDSDNVYYLVSNLPRLVEVITNLVNDLNTGSNPGTETPKPAAPTPKVYPAKKAATPKADSSTYSNKDLSNATDLINNLDKLLSSLLSDATFNDFSLDKTDNIFASLVTFLSNYLGNDFADSADEIVRLINSYAYYITGSETHKANSNHDVNDKKVYTNDSLTGLVVETYTLIEKIAAKLLEKYNHTYNLDDASKANYNLLVEAIDGIISPDAISVRLKDDYSSAAKTIAKYDSWQNMAKTTSRGDYKVSINWGINAGNKDAFYDALSASLRLVTSILGVLLIDTGWYNTVLVPVLGAICTPNGIKLESFSKLKADKDKTGNYDATLIAVLTPVSELINQLLNKPATTLIKVIQGLAGILDDKHGATIASIVKNVFNPLIDEVNGLANILDKDISNLSPTFAQTVRGLTDTIANLAKTDKNGALVNIKLGKTEKNKYDQITKDYRIALSGTNLIPIINTLLNGKGITLKQINWYKLSTAKTPAAALVYVLEYVLEILLESSLLDSLGSEIGDLLSGLTAKDILGILDRVLEASDSPTLAYWTFVQYLQEKKEGFTYPAGITKAMADQGVESLDQMVAAIFPLLSTFGVDLGGNDLNAVLNNKLFTNKLLTQLATALYGALDSLDPTIKAVLNGLGIATSTKDVAKLLTDKSYGATYSSAAKTISTQSNWKNVKNVNWGFTDGTSGAQQGFVNALVAILRPVSDILAVFLNEGTLHIDDAAYDIICGIEVKRTTTNLEFDLGDQHFNARIAYAMKNGVFAVSLREDPSSSDRSRSSTLKIDFKSLKNLNDLKLEGTNGYNSAIIPLLEVLQCSNVKTYAQYQKDVANAKDNLLLDILNPLVGSSSSSFLNKLAAKPFSELTKLLPNLAMYIDGNGLVQLVNNLLAPITYAITGDNESDSLGEIIESFLGAPLQDAVIPLVNDLLKSKGINIRIPNINWNALISLGDASTYTSKATDLNGRYLTGKIVSGVDQGKVLITVLRYVANILITNSTALKNLICSIDAVAKNDLIKSIVQSVFNTIGTASVDQLVSAVFYLLSSSPENAFWDYTSYKTGEYSFAFPESMDVDFVKNLPPMLDGLIGSFIDLNGKIGELLFTDSLVTKLATGLYGAIEGVKINDGLNLAQLLAQTGIDFTTSNVASLLVNEKYGKTYQENAAIISAAGSWKNVNADALKWGVTDRDSFFHALVAVLRPIYGVLDVLLNDAYLGLFDIVRIPGSNGYTSSIVPLMEAFSMYNIKTQYQYRQDMTKEYDAILLDIINPLWDKVEDILNAPLQTLMAVIPNLALFIGNDGLCQIIDNLLTPISALADAIRPIVDLNSLLTTVLGALKVDLNGILAKVGITNFSLDVYDLNKTLKPLLGGDAIIPLLNNVLGLIKIKGTPLGLKLNDVDWLQLASHGTVVVSASQAATYGSRIFVEGDSAETLIAILRYLISTINAGDNFDKISSLIGGLLGDGVADNISSMINEVLGMLSGEPDEVISSLVDLLQSIA